MSLALENPDRVILTDIYGAGEENKDAVDVYDLYQKVKAAHHPNVSVVAKNEIVEYLCDDTSLAGAVAFLGAGDITEIADEFAKRRTNSN